MIDRWDTDLVGMAAGLKFPDSRSRRNLMKNIERDNGFIDDGVGFFLGWPIIPGPCNWIPII